MEWICCQRSACERAAAGNAIQRLTERPAAPCAPKRFWAHESGRIIWRKKSKWPAISLRAQARCQSLRLPIVKLFSSFSCD
eukprot:scaffold193_cov203-Alexandrium_tamarense.AAC.15